jgi:putative redox protein
MKYDFKNKNGEVLSGRLELPKGDIDAIALFAHCFTCSKNLIAPSTISRRLTDQNIGVLRFDFTGLGMSEGDFSNTNFSSNVDDLVSACLSLEESHFAPSILIGHSLGGAAVLKASAELKSIKAVATIGAPSSTDHVSHLFADDLPKIKSQGQAEVNLAGRNFLIKKQFIDDLEGTHLLSQIEQLRKAWLIMHSPIDNTVSIDHAAEIYQNLHHPKSFISLDDADHLLNDKKDADYAAQVIGVWARRYI